MLRLKIQNMIFNTKTILKDLQGEPIVDEEGVELTLGRSLSNALANIPSKNPWKSYMLAKKVYENDNVELSSEDIVFIKEVVTSSSRVMPLTAGQMIDILEGNK